MGKQYIMARPGYDGIGFRLAREADVYDENTGMAFCFAIEQYNTMNARVAQQLGGTHWTYLCSKCVDRFDVDINKLDDMEGSEAVWWENGNKSPIICAVMGCDQPAMFFYDFYGTTDFFEWSVRRANEKTDDPSTVP